MCVIVNYTCRKIDEEKFLPVLMYILTHGNVTVYEWKHDEPPPNQNQNGTGVKLENGNESGDFEIDWGDLSPSSGDQQEFATSAEIDFGESEIDFGTDIDLSTITIEESGEIDETSGTVDELVVATNTPAQTSGILLSTDREVKAD